MSTAGSKSLHVTFSKQFIAKSGVAFTKGVGVTVDAVGSDGVVTVDVAATGEKCIGIANESLTTAEADGVRRIECALLTGGGTLRVKASGTATAGAAAKTGTDGFENQTFGGGTTVGYSVGQFLESGVDGDFVELAIAPFVGVTA